MLSRLTSLSHLHQFSIKGLSSNFVHAAMKEPLILELVNDRPDRKEMFFSKPFLRWQHHSNIADRELAGYIRAYLRDFPDGEIHIRNSVVVNEINKLFS